MNPTITLLSIIKIAITGVVLYLLYYLLSLLISGTLLLIAGIVLILVFIYAVISMLGINI